MIGIFDHHDMKLPWQADDGEHGNECLGDKRRGLNTIGGQGANQVCLLGTVKQVSEPAVQTETNEKANGHEGHKFDQ